MAKACNAKIVASGGAGKMEHFLDAVQAGAQILLAASVFHFHMIDIGELKAYLKEQQRINYQQNKSRCKQTVEHVGVPV